MTEPRQAFEDLFRMVYCYEHDNSKTVELLVAACQEVLDSEGDVIGKQTAGILREAIAKAETLTE